MAAYGRGRQVCRNFRHGASRRRSGWVHGWAAIRCSGEAMDELHGLVALVAALASGWGLAGGVTTPDPCMSLHHNSFAINRNALDCSAHPMMKAALPAPIDPLQHVPSGELFHRRPRQHPRPHRTAPLPFKTLAARRKSSFLPAPHQLPAASLTKAF